MEEVLHFTEKTALFRLFSRRWQTIAQLLKDLALIAGEFGRDMYFDVNEEVSTTGGIDARNPSVFETKLSSGLRTFRDLDLLNTLEGGNLDFGPKGCLYEVDWHSAMQVVILTVENRVVLYAEHNVQISAWPAIGTGLTFPVEAELRASIDASGDVDLQLLLTAQSAFTLALRARPTNDLTAPATGGAGALDGHEALLEKLLATSAAGRAGCESIILFSTRTDAAGAEIEFGNLNINGCATHGIFEVDFKIIAEVFPATLPTTALAASTAAAKKVAEKVAEDIVEIGKLIGIEA